MIYNEILKFLFSEAIKYNVESCNLYKSDNYISFKITIFRDIYELVLYFEFDTQIQISSFLDGEEQSGFNLEYSDPDLFSKLAKYMKESLSEVNL